MKKKMDNKGFSLVELIIVIAIMVILVAVLAPQYLKYVEKSRVATDTQTTVEFINAMQVIAADPDISLSSTGTYKVTNNGGEKIEVSKDLGDALIKNGIMESGSLTGSGPYTSTSRYQSTAYTGTTITLTLTYKDVDPADATKGKIWAVTCTGVDNSGAIASGAGGGGGAGAGS